jgi:hypothetical protein
MDSDTLVRQVIAISFLVGSIVRLDCSLVPKHNLLFIFIFLRSEKHASHSTGYLYMLYIIIYECSNIIRRR